MKLKTLWSPHDIRSRLNDIGGVGFLFHATDPATVQLAFEDLPTDEESLWDVPPFIGCPIFVDNSVIGAHLISPIHAGLWANGHNNIRRFRNVAYEPLLTLAEQCGLTHLGLAALLPFATNNGRYRPPVTANCITTGHAATVAAIRQTVAAVAERAQIDDASCRYAIVGAAGSIGSNVARWFVQNGLHDIRLVDVRDRLHSLETLAEELTQNSNSANISVHAYNDLSGLPTFDIGIVATSASSPWMNVDLLSAAPIWIDDSHPRAATVSAERELRGKVMYLECYLRGPQGMSQTFPFRLPTPRDCYSCFAEVFVCWREDMQTDFVVGTPTLEQIEIMDKLLPAYGFCPGPFTSKDGHEHTEDTIAETMRRLTNRCTRSRGPRGL